MSVATDSNYEIQQLPEAIEQIQSNAKSGRLLCQKGRERAYIYFEQGEIMHAAYDDLVGEQVLYALISWNRGYLEFEDKSAALDYDTSCSIDHHQALIFQQTLGLFRPARVRIALVPDAPARSGFSQPHWTDIAPVSEASLMPERVVPKIKSIFRAEAKVAQASGNTGRELAEKRETAPKLPPTLLFPPGKSSAPSLRLKDTELAWLVQQAGVANPDGYLKFEINHPGQPPESGVVVLEGGELTAVSYNTNKDERLLWGQAACDALAAALAGNQATMSSFQSDSKLLKPYRAILCNQLTRLELWISKITIVEIVSDLAQKRASAALRLSNADLLIYYLLSEGETLGCYEVKDNMLVPSKWSFAEVVDKAKASLEILNTPPIEFIRLSSSKTLSVSNLSVRPAPIHPEPVNFAAEVKETNRTSSFVEQGIDWGAIIERGRKPYSNLPSTSQNFNGLRRAFDQGAYTGVIEASSSNFQLYYLIENGMPLGLYKLDPHTNQHRPSDISIFSALDKFGVRLNVFLEDNKISTQFLFERYMLALREGAFDRAIEVVQEALRGGLAATTIYDAIFAQAMRQVGSLWETGKMTIAQEHLATGITEYCRNLIANSQTTVPAANHVGRVLLTSVSGNIHTLGLGLLSDVFRWRSWEVFPLFSELPEVEVAEAVLRYQIDLVCLSVSMPGQLVKAIKTIRAIKQTGWKGLIEVGGAAFTDNSTAFEQTGADFLGGDAEATVEEATRRMTARSTHLKF